MNKFQLINHKAKEKKIVCGMPFFVKKRVLNIHHDPHHHEEQMLEFIEMMG